MDKSCFLNVGSQNVGSYETLPSYSSTVLILENFGAIMPLFFPLLLEILLTVTAPKYKRTIIKLITITGKWSPFNQSFRLCLEAHNF